VKETTWREYGLVAFGSLCVCVALWLKTDTPSVEAMNDPPATEASSDNTEELTPPPSGSWDVIEWGVVATEPDSPAIKYVWAKFLDDSGKSHTVPKCQLVTLIGETGAKVTSYSDGTWILVVGVKEHTDHQSNSQVSLRAGAHASAPFFLLE
jgi:hypothetical protein